MQASESNSADANGGGVAGADRSLFRRVRIAPNDPQGPLSIVPGDGYSLSVIEFDDQGAFYDRRQLDALEEKLRELAGEDTIILVFVHGWKHNADREDDNLLSFQQLLEQTAAADKASGARVLGVFIGWRGRSLSGLGLENFTFWDRKQAAHRVGEGSVREVFWRLREFRRNNIGRDRLSPVVILGHSFGGLIVYTAVAESLIEAASTAGGDAPSSLADLVVLVNPAFEAVRYLPVHSKLEHCGESSFPPGQKPVFVSVTAENDWATGLAFPLGSVWSLLQEETRGKQEQDSLVRTMGHVPWMATHRISAAGHASGDPAKQRPIGPAVIERTRFADNNPFWVMAASSEVICGHNHIFTPVFEGFIRELVVEQIGAAKARRNAAGDTGTATAAAMAEPPAEAPAASETEAAGTESAGIEAAEAESSDPAIPAAAVKARTRAPARSAATADAKAEPAKAPAARTPKPRPAASAAPRRTVKRTTTKTE